MNKEELEELYSIAFEDKSIQSEAIKEHIKKQEQEIDRLNNIIKELSKDVDMWNKKYNEQFNIITELEKWLEERTYGMNEIHTYKIGALEDEVILNKLKELKENNKE